MLNPITFSIPNEKIINYIPVKTKILSSLIPGKLSTYIYNNEEDYYNEYRQSYFAMTTKKGGWDCMRHYEIIANGCVPFFPNIEKCPTNTMGLFPKHLLYKGNLLYNSKFINKQINELTKDVIEEYNNLVFEFLEYTRNYLSTIKMASYVLEKSNCKNKHKNKEELKMLYLSGPTGPDYLRCLTLHGFKKLIGSNCHDYPKIPHIYKTNTIDYKCLYGKGITYTNLLDSCLHNDALDINIEEAIKNKYYDIIIYGSYHRGMPYFDLVNKVYNPNDIILFCGEDIHRCNYNGWVEKGYNVFVREL